MIETIQPPAGLAASAPAVGDIARPCQAMLAICSDLDETPDGESFLEIMRFLNTKEETSMGRGVGLEVGNTIYFDMPPGHFSYWNTTDDIREKLRALIRSGHIDCLHSFGDLATTRRHAMRALEELVRHDCRLRVWIDHAQAPSNFGADIMQGHGDEPGHPVYHADLTMEYGIDYIWRGRVTSVIGQDRPFTLGGIANWRDPLASLRTLGREAAKQLLSQLGHHKYALHAGNHLVKPGSLRDGQAVLEFLRCGPHWAGVSAYDRGDGIQHVLTREFLDRLVERGGYCILYTHLGKLGRGEHRNKLSAAAVAAFRLLAEYATAGKVCVTTTSRLLDARQGTIEASTLARSRRLEFPSV